MGQFTTEFTLNAKRDGARFGDHKLDFYRAGGKLPRIVAFPCAFDDFANRDDRIDESFFYITIANLPAFPAN